ncbi:hypothetical protein Ciccas_010525 [Cichlidogyrus casuarinus]|uniref:Uncharacterized protein n=1 Tax=Cichlidogyrus casuarinus TaxID=1844966 RepID=A0ABD2PV14_9PLAT
MNDIVMDDGGVTNEFDLEAINEIKNVQKPKNEHTAKFDGECVNAFLMRLESLFADYPHRHKTWLNKKQCYTLRKNIITNIYETIKTQVQKLRKRSENSIINKIKSCPKKGFMLLNEYAGYKECQENNNLSKDILDEIASLNFSSTITQAVINHPKATLGHTVRRLMPQEVIQVCKMTKSKHQKDDHGLSIGQFFNLP